MTDHSSHDRDVTLATGDRLPLRMAARHLSVLASYLGDPDSDWHYVYLLREVCLDREVEPEQRRALIREGLLDDDGDVDPALRAVVRAAVRGEDRQLRLESPFTAPLDRVMSEYLCARTFIRGHLDPTEAESFLAADPGRDSLEGFQNRIPPPPNLPPPWEKKWADRESERGDRPTDDLPPL